MDLTLTMYLLIVIVLLTISILLQIKDYVMPLAMCGIVVWILL